MSRRTWYVILNALVGLWLAAAGIAAVCFRLLPAGNWLMVHLLLLGALSTAIFVWSQHFADTLLRHRSSGGRVSLGVRVGLHTFGALGVVTGVVTGFWPVVVAGAALIAVAAIVHAVSLVQQLRGSLPARFGPLVRYYVAAAAALVVGITLGVIMARPDVVGQVHDRLFVAHIGMNVLGWVGLTVIGTVVLLWPTVLRTKARASSDTAAKGALPLLGAGVVLIGLACLLDLRIAVAFGVLIYLVGFGQVLIEVYQHGKQSRPASFASWSIGAALIWFAIAVLGFGVFVVTAPTWTQIGDRVAALVPLFAVGFAAQILLGALSYLLPVALGGGPEAARASARELDRAGIFRIVVTNFGGLLYVLPVPSLVKAALAVLVFGTLVSFLVFAVRAVAVARRVRLRPNAGAASVGGPRAVPPPIPRRSGMVTVAAGALVLAMSIGVALDPGSIGIAVTSAGGETVATGHTTTVEMSMANYRFTPSTVEVPVGDKLVIHLTNADDMLHDLVLSNGVTSGSVAPGRSVTVDVGVIGADLEGWCSVAGHRQLGMVMKVVAAGGAAASGDHSDHAAASGPSAAGDLDLMARPGAGFVARDPVLPAASAQTVHTLTLTVKNVKTEVAPGVTQELWTYNGTAPGPTLRGKVGDVFDITLVNDGTIGHSIDFHAGALAPDKPMRTIPPGQRLEYRFTATRSGIWLYHCSTMPMSLHIANGMFGAVVIDPIGLTPVDQEYLVVQSEYYLGPQGGAGDAVKVAAQKPDLVVFNGYANQYRDRPIAATVGEKVRVWVLDAGPNIGSAFHIVGAQFDTVYKEGDYLLKDGGSTGSGGSQALDLSPAQGGFVELTFPEAGNYSVLSHVMSDAEKGASGLFQVRQ
ncbi:multicopper oxidase domain-containing protein [Parafrigoribacterium mesophilum]|uniref:multicopper oxidase domain-containing protein n=1 Tax=Parafrigoribacterium mesophilum TaxID=433646 RepID=UPI0031FDFA5E